MFRAYLFFLIIGVWLEYLLEPSTAAIEAWDTVRVTLLIFQNAQVLEVHSRILPFLKGGASLTMIMPPLHP
jgi:hypothetical protein